MLGVGIYVAHCRAIAKQTSGGDPDREKRSIRIQGETLMLAALKLLDEARA